MGVVKNSHVMIWSHETIQFNNGHGEKRKEMKLSHVILAEQ